MRTLASIIVFACSVSLGAQDTIPKQDSLKPRVFRNEIGTNIGPLALILLGAEPFAQPLMAVHYKRVFDKFALRFTAGVKKLPSWYYQPKDDVFAIDSMYRVRRTEHSELSYLLRLGVEKRKKTSTRLYFVFGADLIALQKQSRDLINEITYRIDSIVRKGTPDEYRYMTQTSALSRRDETTVTNFIGLGGSAGLMLPIGKRLWLLGHFRADFYFSRRTQYYTDPVTGKREKGTASVFDFETGPPVSEVSLFFRF
jgi:hypothetical protein